MVRFCGENTTYRSSESRCGLLCYMVKWVRGRGTLAAPGVAKKQQPAGLNLPDRQPIL